MKRKILITGGAGFIGSNFARHRIQLGDEVTIFDNLSRKGAENNLAWIGDETPGKRFEFIKGDVRDLDGLLAVIKGKDVIVHLAAQVAVTSSVIQPAYDFDVNAFGTFNVMEAARQVGEKPLVIYASTNKVYGEIENISVIEGKDRYQFETLEMGVNENQPLDFHSPYGCSKGCGDQYVRDYSRMYGFPTVVFRQSCIYGPRQFGIEDQGWVAWFIIAAVLGKPISIYGDGKQVRDVLHINDLIAAYDKAIDVINTPGGDIFNIGGGPRNAIAIWREFGPILERIHGATIPILTGDWRPGDQKIYISDITKAKEHLGWSPSIGVEVGIRGLYDWVKENKALFA
jgi:CDP-paratose 2-epimerase